MVRAVFLTHGLNEKRIETLVDDDSFVRIVRDVAAREGKIHVLYCDDGFSKAWRDDPLVPPDVAFCKYWKALIDKIVPKLPVHVLYFSFQGDPAVSVDLLRRADFFFLRGTSPGTYTSLAEIVSNPDYSKIVLELQYRVLLNKMVFIGVCGGALVASYKFEPVRHQCMDGFGFMGRGMNIYYDDWQHPVRRNSVQISQVHYAIIDTTLDIATVGVMCNKGKHTFSEKNNYKIKAGEMQTELKKMLSYLRNEKGKDLYTDTCTGRVFAIDVYIGEARWYS